MTWQPVWEGFQLVAGGWFIWLGVSGWDTYRDYRARAVAQIVFGAAVIGLCLTLIVVRAWNREVHKQSPWACTKREAVVTCKARVAS